MVVFLKSMGNKVWKNMIKGRKHPVITYEDGTTGLKPEATNVEDEEALENSKDLNAIFNGVYKNMFRLINTCSEAKEACEIIKTAHEGISNFHMSRLKLLSTKFENLRMNKEELICDFHIRLCDISNTSFALGEKMSEQKLTR